MELLLTTARAVFDERGYDFATIRVIARAAGMSTGAIFAHWSGKAELYRDVYGHDPITPEQGRKLATALVSLGADPVQLLAA